MDPKGLDRNGGLDWMGLSHPMMGYEHSVVADSCLLPCSNNRSGVPACVFDLIPSPPWRSQDCVRAAAKSLQFPESRSLERDNPSG